MVKFCQGEELLVAERGNDPCGYVAYSSFGVWLIFWRTYPCRYDCCAIVFSHFMVHGINLLVIPVFVMDDCRLAVIWHKDFGNSSEIVVHMDVCSYPCSLLFVKERFCVGILAVSHDTH